MAIKIETYRGFDILFEPQSERFTFALDEGSWTTKQSYSACKKNIDDFIKNNNNFKPFYAIKKDAIRKVFVTGIRKDNKFVFDDGILSDWDEKYYILHEESFDNLIDEYNKLYEEFEKIKEEYYSKVNELKSKITGKTLVEYKKELLENNK